MYEKAIISEFGLYYFNDKKYVLNKPKKTVITDQLRSLYAITHTPVQSQNV